MLITKIWLRCNFISPRLLNSNQRALTFGHYHRLGKNVPGDLEVNSALIPVPLPSITSKLCFYYINFFQILLARTCTPIPDLELKETMQAGLTYTVSTQKQVCGRHMRTDSSRLLGITCPGSKKFPAEKPGHAIQTLHQLIFNDCLHSQPSLPCSSTMQRQGGRGRSCLQAACIACSTGVASNAVIQVASRFTIQHN